MRHGRLWGDDDGCVFLGRKGKTVNKNQSTSKTRVFHHRCIVVTRRRHPSRALPAVRAVTLANSPTVTKETP